MNPIDLTALPRSALLDTIPTAQAMGQSPGTLEVWRSTGRYNLPFIKVGSRVKYRVGDILDWLEKRTRTNGATE